MLINVLFNQTIKGSFLPSTAFLLDPPPVIRFLSYFVFLCLCLNIWVKSSYVPGTHNIIADALSRFQMARFCSLRAEADPIGFPCLGHLWDLICILLVLLLKILSPP